MKVIHSKPCPFVTRASITPKRRGIAHRMALVDMDDPPQWCKGIWPPGKMSRLSDLLRQFLSNHDA